jgi:hypothetical protein
MKPIPLIAVAMRALSVLTVVGSVGAPPVQAAAQSENRFALAGRWTGDEWGDVVVASDGSGSYTDTYHTGPGRLHLVRAGERRYEGTWSESSQRYGTVVLELAPDGEVARGTWTPSQESTIGSMTGGSVLWLRGSSAARRTR